MSLKYMKAISEIELIDAYPLIDNTDIHTCMQ